MDMTGFRTVCTAIAVLASATIRAASYETYDITGETEITEETFANTLNISGTAVVKGVTLSAGTLNLGGTASAPAIVSVGGSQSKLYVTNVVIGANGGCGLLRSTGWWSYITLRDTLTIHANTPLSPDSEYVDFARISRYHFASGRGFYNNTAHRARVTFAKDSGGISGYITSGEAWGAYIFRAGEFVLEGIGGAPAWIVAGGGGGSFNPETYVTKLVEGSASVEFKGACNALFTTTGTDKRCLSIANATFSNTGIVAVTNIGVKIAGPVTFGTGVSAIILGGNGVGYLDLAGHTVTGRTMHVDAGVVKTTAAGGTLVFAPAAEEVQTFTGAIASPAVLRKAGAGTLALGASTVSSLEIAEGTVRVTSPAATIASLAVAAGAELVVDGCAFAWPGSADAVEGGVRCINGGSIVSASNSSIFGGVNLSGGIVKDGAGKLIVYDPAALGGTIHVAAGTLAFSREGLTAPYHRWTFKELSDCSATVSAGKPKALILADLWLWGDDGTRIASGAMSNADDLTPPANLAAGYIAWQCEVEYGSANSWLRSLKKIFDSGTDDRPILVAPVIDPADSSTWLSFAYRLPVGSRPAIDYDLRAEYYRPRSWTVEASENGVDWIVVDDRAGVEPVDNTGYTRFFDGGDRNSPTHKFRLSGYVTEGVRNMPADASVQVDEGATIDFSAVSGGQRVNEIAVDAAAGAGTLVNAKAAAEGSLRIVSPVPLSGVIDTGLSVGGIADAQNMSGWAVYVNGVLRKGWCVCTSGETITVLPAGMLLIVR